MVTVFPGRDFHIHEVKVAGWYGIWAFFYKCMHITSSNMFIWTGIGKSQQGNKSIESG